METIEIGNMRWVVTPEVPETLEIEHPAVRSKPNRRHQKHISQAKRILARAKLYGMKHVRKVGDGGMISESIENNGWRVVPSHLYGGIIPREGIETARRLTEGIRVKGFLVADDLRAAKKETLTQPTAMPKHLPEERKGGRGVLWAAGAIIAAGLIISLLRVSVGVGVLGMALVFDPLLICVTEDDEWICLYEWWH